MAHVYVHLLAQGFQCPSPIRIAIYANSAITISAMVCMSLAPGLNFERLSVHVGFGVSFALLSCANFLLFPVMGWRGPWCRKTFGGSLKAMG